MKIGIYDDKFYSLQQHLLQHRHELLVYAGNFEANPREFNVTGVQGKIVQARTLGQLIDGNCDLYFTGTQQADAAYDVLKSLGKRVIGHSESICELEYNRDYAHRVIRSQTRGLKLPQQKEFTKIEDVRRFLQNTNLEWVVKQSSLSPDEPDNRTVVSYRPHKQVLSMLPANRAWFSEEGTGGVILEEYIRGREVCFGRWFNGDHFVGPMYLCEEHKGAQNGDRGRMLTGEVGGWTRTGEPKLNGLMPRVFKALEPVFRGRCHGLIDINTRINESGVYFLEFTCRWGRPTLEYILGGLNEGQDFAQPMLELSAGGIPEYDYQDYTAGVTVFSYGIPYGSSGIPSVAFDMPHINKGQFSRNIPLFCTYRDGSWNTEEDERQFTVVGRLNDLESAVRLAYEPLTKFSLLGCTWRDDVGKNHREIQELLDKHNVVRFK